MTNHVHVYLPLRHAQRKARDSIKLIKSVKEQNREAKIYRNSDSDEYVVKLYVKGIYQTAADYFTDALDDAEATAKAMVKPRGKDAANLQLKTVKTSGDWSIKEWVGPDRPTTMRPFEIYFKNKIMAQTISSLASAERQLTDFIGRFGKNPKFNSVGGLIAGDARHGRDFSAKHIGNFVFEVRDPDRRRMITLSNVKTEAEALVKAARASEGEWRPIRDANLKGKKTSSDSNPRIEQLIKEFYRKNLLEDRSEYDVEDFMKSYGLNKTDAEALFRRVQEEMRK